jgi:epoxyqueuosine reductase
MGVRRDIEEYSKTIDVEKIGFCRAEPFKEIEDRYLNREMLGYMCSLERIDDLDCKVYPDKTLEGAKSFVVILESYSVVKDTKVSEDIIYGKVSPAAVTEDYHKIVYRKLDKLEGYIRDKYNANCKSFCDISPFSDKAIAIRAGLGSIGKNSLLINKDFGTRFFIGYILTDLEIDSYDSSIKEDFCKDCNICVKACPSSCILGNGEINSSRCVSYLTQAKEIPDDLKELMANSIYGCDVCQRVCPHNSFLKNDIKNKVIDPIISSDCNVEELLSISNADFKKTYGKSSSGWRGKKMLQRNAIIALGNDKSEKSIEILEKYKNDIREDIRNEVIEALRKRK